jgi:hypothetical protein
MKEDIYIDRFKEKYNTYNEMFYNYNWASENILVTFYNIKLPKHRLELFTPHAKLESIAYYWL